MRNQAFVVSLCGLMSLAQLFIAQSCVGEEPVSVKSLDELSWMLGTWIKEEETLDDDIPEFGKKGEKATLHVNVQRGLINTWMFSTGALHRDGKTLEVFRDVWGSKPSNTGINCWSFYEGGLMYEAQIVRDGEKFIQMVKGTILPKGEPLEKLAKKLGVEKLDTSAEIVFRRIDDDSMGVTVQKVLVGGTPFPWPGAGKETISHRQP